MMACRVSLCDNTFKPVQDPTIEIEAYDPPGYRSIVKQQNQALSSGHWGADLPVAAADIYDVIIDTSRTPYAPPVLKTFSGAVAPQLDVVLFSLRAAIQAGSTGSAPTTARAVSPFVQSQLWPLEAKLGIFTAIETFSYLNRLQATAPQPVFFTLRGGLFDLLAGLQINPDLIA